LGDSGDDETQHRLINRVTVRLWCRYDPRGAGGIEAFVRELAPHVRALRPSWDVRIDFAFSKPNRVERVPLLGDLIAAIVLAIRSRTSDVVLVNGAEYAWPRVFSARARRRTIVVWHGTRAAEIPALEPHMSFAVRAYRALEIALQRIAFAFPRQIVVGSDVPRELRVTYGRDGNARVIVNGAPQDAVLERLPAEASILWIGTSPYKKGLDMAIAACELARERIPALRLRIVGLEPNDPAIPNAPWIEAVGRLSHDAMRAEYAKATLLLATTRYEACSMAILEAMALGVPIVGSPTLAWMFAETGSAIASFDAASFSASIVGIIGRPGDAMTVAERVLQRTADFSWSRAARDYVEEIEALADAIVAAP